MKLPNCLVDRCMRLKKNNIFEKYVSNVNLSHLVVQVRFQLTPRQYNICRYTLLLRYNLNSPYQVITHSLYWPGMEKKDRDVIIINNLSSTALACHFRLNNPNIILFLFWFLFFLTMNKFTVMCPTTSNKYGNKVTCIKYCKLLLTVGQLGIHCNSVRHLWSTSYMLLQEILYNGHSFSQ